MATLETLYGPSSVTTQTPGIDLPAVAQAKRIDLSPLAALFFARRREQERRQPLNMVQSRALDPQGGPVANVFGGSGGMEDEARMSALRRSIIENEQALRPAPQRMLHGPGITPGYVMDVNAMNAAQRQAFLPNASGLAPGELFGRDEDDFAYSDIGRAIAESGGPYGRLVRRG